MRPFKQLGRDIDGLSRDGIGFNRNAKKLRPSLGGETTQHYNAPIQQTALRERINGGVIAMNFIKTGAY